MSSPVQNTGGNGEGNVDPHTHFEEWLKSHKATQALITKLYENGMDSIEMFEEIKVDDIQDLAHEWNLSTTERLKLQYIIKKMPNKSKQLNNVIYPEEKQAILQMQKKLKDIKQSISDIDEAKQNIKNEVTKFGKLITSTYDDIVTKVIARKDSLLVELKSIANESFADLNKIYGQMEENSVIASSHISCCYEAIHKKVDLTAIDERKANILKVAKTVNDMIIVDKNDPLIKNSGIDFSCNTEEVINIINKSGHFVSVPTPILSKIEQICDGIKIQWKFEKQAKVNKLKVEWCSVDMKEEDAKVDDVKLEWNNSKIFDVHNIGDNDNDNEVIVGLQNEGGYAFRLQCTVNAKASTYSNVKAMLVKTMRGRFMFTHIFTTAATISENGTRVVGTGSGSGGYVTAVASSTGWNSGKYSWKVKCNSHCKYKWDGVGVCTNYERANTNSWLDSCGKTLFYTLYPSCMIRKQKANIKDVTEKWKSGDIMTVNLDCDAWKITFYLNDTDLGTYNLDGNETYYPALQLSSETTSDFKLL